MLILPQGWIAGKSIVLERRGRGREGCHVLLFMGMQCLISIWSGTDHRFNHMNPKSITIVSTFCYQGPEQAMFCCSCSYFFFNTHNFWFFFSVKRKVRVLRGIPSLPPPPKNFLELSRLWNKRWWETRIYQHPCSRVKKKYFKRVAHSAQGSIEALHLYY